MLKKRDHNSVLGFLQKISMSFNIMLGEYKMMNDFSVGKFRFIDS